VLLLIAHRSVRVLALRLDAQRIILIARMTQWRTLVLVMQFVHLMTAINLLAKHRTILAVALEPISFLQIGMYGVEHEINNYL